MPGPAECRTCRHFEPNSATAATGGECRIARPITGDDPSGSARWPYVLGADRCGEHDRRLVPVEA